MANLFLLFGLSAFCIGLFDVGTAEMFEARLTGLAFAVAGAIMIAARVSPVARRWRRSAGRALTPLASASGVLLSVYLLVTQLDYRTGPGWLLSALWLATGVGAVAAGWSTWRRLEPARRRPASSPQPLASDAASDGAVARLSSLGLTAGLALSLLQFWYIYQYTPSVARSFSLTVSVNSQAGGQLLAASDLAAVSAHIVVRNPGSSEIKVLQSAYSVSGVKSVDASGAEPSFADRIRKRQPTWDDVARYSDDSDDELLQVGTFWGELSAIEPSQEHSADIQVIVPRERLQEYAYLRVLLRMIVAKDRLHLQERPERRTLDDCHVDVREADVCTVTRWSMKPPSLLWTLTRGQQVVDVSKNLNFRTSNPQGVWFGPWCVNDAGTKISSREICSLPGDSPGLGGLVNFFGITDITTAATVVLNKPQQASPT